LLYTRALFYMQDQRLQEALQDLNLAARVRPGMQAAYIQMAHIHYQHKNWPAYEAALSQLIQHGNKAQAVYLARAKVRILMKQGDGALADLDALLKQAPRESEALHLRGQLALAKGPQFCEAALKDLRQACRLGRKKACYTKAPCAVPTPVPTPEASPESATTAPTPATTPTAAAPAARQNVEANMPSVRP
jgi:tetratricopeptide (TPR) repeat protein